MLLSMFSIYLLTTFLITESTYALSMYPFRFLTMLFITESLFFMLFQRMWHQFQLIAQEGKVDEEVADSKSVFWISFWSFDGDTKGFLDFILLLHHDVFFQKPAGYFEQTLILVFSSRSHVEFQLSLNVKLYQPMQYERFFVLNLFFVYGHFVFKLPTVGYSILIP